MKNIPLRLLLCFAYACFWQVASAENKGPQNLAELQNEIEKILQRTGTPGAAVAIVSRNKVEWMAGIGLADVAMKKPVTNQTVFRIGSVSKKFVALAALKLQEEGKLKLTDTLRQWVPEYAVDNLWEATDPVRLVHLLEHTSGLPDCRFSEYAHNDPTPVTLAQALAFAPQYRVIRWRPGSRNAYTSVGPTLAAAIVEKVSGQRFEDYVRDNLFVPMGMKTANYFLTPEVQSNLITMYWSDGRKVAPYTHFIYRPSGSINASIEDMANFVRFHLERGSLDGRRILSEASMDRLEVPKTLPAVEVGVTTGYGLCNGAFFDRGHEWHGNAGWWDGSRAWFGYCPELGQGLVVMINSSNEGTLNLVARSMGRYLSRDIPEGTLPAAAPMPDFLKRDFEGYYANIAPRNEGYTDFSEYFLHVRKVSMDGKGMSWQPALGGWSQRWVPVSDKLFRRENATKPALAVIKGERGEPLFQSNEGTFQRISSIGFWSVVGGIILSAVLLGSTVLFALVWGPRRALGRLKNAGPLSLQIWPLVGAAGVFAVIIFYVNVQEGCLDILGTPNFWSIGIMMVSYLIPLGALLGAFAIWRHRQATMNRVAYWHAVLVTVSLIFMSGFGLCWGLIGMRLWA